MGEHFDANNPKHQAMMNRLEAMETRAKNLDTDFDAIVENVHVEMQGQFSILEMKIDNDEVKEDMGISGIFNTHSQSDQSLNRQHKQELSIENTIIQKPIGMNL